MKYRYLVSAGALAVVLGSVSPAFVPVAGQTQKAGAPAYTPPLSTYSPPRTPWGDPDLQGVWDYQTIIRMERAAQFAGKAMFTDAELAEYAKTFTPNEDACGTGSRANEVCTPEELAQVGDYNDFWDNRNWVKDNRTSLIVDPSDGRRPPLTPEAQKRLAAAAAARRASGRVQYESWEDFSAVTRCIAEQTPNGPQMYNSGTLITQSPGWIVLFRERLDTRIIPLDKRPHIDQHIRQWNGDSRGWWEGNTLVVETTNFTDKQIMGGVGSTIPAGIPFGNIHLIERWVPVSAKRIHYYATVTDSTTWTKPWTFMLPWERDDTYTVYEFACHEANISIENALRGERLLEKKAEEAAKKAIPVDQISAGLIGATEATLRVRLGEPTQIVKDRWTYETLNGTHLLLVYFAEGKVKIVQPNDLPLEEVKRR